MAAFLTSANRDEDVCGAPQEFDIGREPNLHVGFSGGGPHDCLGRHLAAPELRVMLKALAQPMPTITAARSADSARTGLLDNRLAKFCGNALTPPIQ